MKKTNLLVVGTLFAALTGLGAAEAKVNWEKHCAECHGSDGKGDTQMGKKFGARDFTNSKVQSELVDSEMHRAIKEGIKAKGTDKPKMKAFGNSLNEEEIKELVSYVRSFRKQTP